MGLRYRKSVNILPGIKLNFSKSGISTTIGKKGMGANFSDKGVRTTVGILGTGISYSSTSSKRRVKPVNVEKAINANKQHNWFLDNIPSQFHAKKQNNTNKTNWGCASALLGIFLFICFLIIGQQPLWAFSSLLVFGLIYYLCVIKK